MDRRDTPQWTAAGLIEAPLEKVWPNVIEGNSLAQIAQTTPPQNGMIVTENEHLGRIEIDLNKHTILTQGHWWYRGIHRLETHPRGCVLRYEVYNIASGMGWWAAQLVQGPQHAREMSHQMEHMLQAIGKRLSCCTSVIES
jgi:hypothetical protein